MKGKKTGGRKKGTPNKTTQFGKELINEILADYTNDGAERNMFTDLAALDPKERLDVMVKLMAFITPKPQSIDLNLAQETREAIDDKLARLSKENDI